MKTTSRQEAKIKSAPGDTARHKDREFTAKLVQILNFGFSWTVFAIGHPMMKTDVIVATFYYFATGERVVTGL